MPVTDPIGDLLTRIRNADRARKDSLVLPYSKIKESVLEIMQERGYIAAVERLSEDKLTMIKVDLRPGAIEDLQRVSKPGRRIYTTRAGIPYIKNGRGMVIVSTSKGLMSGEKAKKEGLGGELLLKVW